MSQQFPPPGSLPPGEPRPAAEPPPAPPPESRPQVLPSDLPDRTPWLTYVILGITIAVYLAQVGTSSLLGYDLPAALGMKINDRIASGEIWRLFTPMLLHGGLLHIGFNMYALYLIGPELERYFGPLRFILLYLLSGFAGNVISMAFTQANSLGASTAIFGLFGAQGVFIYQNRDLFGKRAQVALRRIINLSIINLIIGLQPGIDNWGHIGGLAGGVAFTWYAGPLLGWEELYARIRLRDRRGQISIFLAALGIGLLLVLIAAGLILIRRGIL